MLPIILNSKTDDVQPDLFTLQAHSQPNLEVVAGAIIGMVLAAFHYNGQDSAAIQGAVPGIIMLMSWIPTIIALIGAVIMALYPLNQKKMDEITIELNKRRESEQALNA
jgi:glycoside/pentoside/hexuronide:cation symporter, GPH family